MTNFRLKIDGRVDGSGRVLMDDSSIKSFLFYAPVVGAGLSGDGVGISSNKATFKNMASNYFETFSEFVTRRMSLSDRITDLSFNPCVDKNYFIYNLIFPAVGFDNRTARAYLATPSSLCRITEMQDIDSLTGIGNGIFSINSAISGTSGLLEYKGNSYYLYTISPSLPAQSERNYIVKTYI